MALDNPIGNPLEPHDRPQYISDSSVVAGSADRDVAGFHGIGPVDDSMIGGTARPGVPEIGDAASDFAGGADGRSGRRHLALVPNGFDELFDAVEESWQDRALCAQTDPEAFFPEKGGSTREAKRICQGCEVKAECLEYALHNDERFGIWGGLSERERRRLKRGII